MDTAYYDTTDIAVYFIEKSYDVERDSVTVPAAIKTFTSAGAGNFECLANNSIVADGNECPPADTTFNDCFKVTQILTMTMMGSGVEFGQRRESWLAYKKGLVKSEIHVRDIENHPDFDFEPFRISAQKGIQTLDLMELKE